MNIFLTRRRLAVRALVLTFLIAVASGAAAEDLAGSVRDATGAAVGQAAVRLVGNQQTTIASTQTDARGEFTLRGVTPGSYVLSVTARGFAEQRRVVQVVAGKPSAPLALIVDVAPVTDEVTVTANRGGVEHVRRTVQPVNVITDEEIRLRAQAVVAQAAREEVGLEVQRTSPTVSGVFVRGLTGAKVNVYVDGVRYSTSTQRGGVSTFMSLIDPATVEGLEVLRGPNSAQYGSDALGGSLQFLSQRPPLSTTGSPAANGRFGLSGGSADQSFGSYLTAAYSRPRFGAAFDLVGRRVNTLRPGEGLDSHSAFTRFFDLPSDMFMGSRLPDTAFTQYGWQARLQWAPSDTSQVSVMYQQSHQDGSKRYDQLLGGDGNLLADVRDLMVDFGYARYHRARVGWFDTLTGTYSFNAQREERVNQGGNGNPNAPITYEFERTTVNGGQFEAGHAYENSSLTFGADYYAEGVDAPSHALNPVTEVSTVRRGRIPDGATYRSGGVYAQGIYDPSTRLRLVGNVRWSGARYRAEAADSPLVNGQRLWPDDAQTDSRVTYRAGANAAIGRGVSVAGSFSTGFRAPSITDLGTLGLTGSGFEVDAQAVGGLGATIGSSAAASAVSTGVPVTQLVSETSRNLDLTARFDGSGFSTALTTFVNDIDGNIQKYALILPPGAVGLELGGQPIVAQSPTGTVFVSLSSNPVLARLNVDNVRIWGLEYTFNWTPTRSWQGSAAWTYLHAEDRDTGLPPNVEGGTPATGGVFKLRYTRPTGRFWVEPYFRAALRQTRLSSLDLEDRRTGATRSRTSIRNFFLNGATFRGYVGAGADGKAGTADDVLLATGETLAEIQLRVLGTATSAPLYTDVPAYATVNVRGGVRIGKKQDVTVELENLTDQNHRGISWGMDAPGVNLYCTYRISF